MEPIKILGVECISASYFLTFKKNLKSKGVDVSELKPSSKIAPYLEKYFSPMIEEVVLSGVKIFEKLEYKMVPYEKINENLWDRLFQKFKIKREFETGDVVTFRDLINKILMNTGDNTI